ncbi:MAG: C25 family cysteine peptidase [Promethearchaeota archaeon]
MVRFSLKKVIYLLILITIFSPFINFIWFNGYGDSREINISHNTRISNGYMDVGLSILPEIDYVALNETWYNPKIEMLIITPNRTDFINASEPLADWKNEKGVKTIILSNFSLYEGRDDAEKIRNMIKSYYETEKIRWVLLVGDAQDNLIPTRYVYNPDLIRWTDGVNEIVGDNEYKPTDYYYADLTGTWNSDNDGKWGESSYDNAYNLDEISWTPEVYVGRLPADDANELAIMINKTLKYETNPEVGDWMNRMLLAGGISEYDPPEYESYLTTHIIQNYAKNELNYTHLIEEPGGTGNLTLSNLVGYFNDGYSTVLMAGHGRPTSYYRNPSTAAYRSSDASTSTNDYMPSLVYLDACSTSSYDSDYSGDGSIGETLINKEYGGAIGVIGGLRITWYHRYDTNLEKLNRGNAKLFWKEFFVNKKFQQGKALYDSKVAYLNSDYYTFGSGSTSYDFERKNLFTYCLLGDPELDIYTNKPKVALNPFIDNIYEGQLVSITIRDINGMIIPYARVHLNSSDGKYHTTYADENGLASFRLPAQENETYNVLVTGHNLIPSYFNFTTLPDDSNPQLIGVNNNPKNPSTSDITTFTVEAQDNKSGIECVYIFLSKNNFTDYTYYGLSNSFEENQEVLSITTERLTPGVYSYFIITRDYANNTLVIQDSTFNFSIPLPMIDYIIPVSIAVIIAIVGVSIFILLNGMRKHKNSLKRI